MDQIPNEEIKKVNMEFRKEDLMLIIPSLLIGYLLQVLVLFGDLSAGIVLFECSVYAVTFWYMKRTGIKADKRGNSLLICVALLNIPFILYDYGAFRFVYLAFLILLTAFQIYTMLGLRTKSLLSDMFNSSVTWTLSNMNCSGHAVRAASKQGKGRSVLLVLLGLMLSAIVVSVLTFLLMMADAAFEGMIDMISTSVFEEASQHIGYFLLGIPFSMIAFGMLYAGRVKRNCNLVKPVEDEKFKLLPTAFAAAVFIPIVILYILYIVSQGAYLFSAFSSLLPENYTYAEYARRGFFELCGISVINILLITVLNVFAKANGRASRIFCKAVSAFVCIISLMMISTAIAKMVMYMNIYGLSVKRIYTTIFMAAIAVIFILVIVKLFAAKFKLIRLTAIVLTVMIIASSYIDVDRLTAAYNLNAYENGRLDSFDYYMLLDMSDSALPYLIEYADEHNSFDERNIASIKMERIKDSGLTLTGFNLSTLSALRAIEDVHWESPRQ